MDDMAENFLKICFMKDDFKAFLCRATIECGHIGIGMAIRRRHQRNFNHLIKCACIVYSK